MRKLPQTQIDEEPHRRKKTSWLMAIVLGLFLAPLVFEGSAICAAQWRSMFGPVVMAETPVLDRLGPEIGNFASAISSTTLGVLLKVPWRSSYVIPIACVWALCGSLLLRRV